MQSVKISPDLMKVDAFAFFYHQQFNPCWGNTAAVDIDGSIKPCLWAGEEVGNIHETGIRELITLGKFDRYWELTKDKLERCKHVNFDQILVIPGFYVHMIFYRFSFR
jgi:sulfatase maturation enzyme AslB (radical SAM superfamily)